MGSSSEDNFAWTATSDSESDVEVEMALDEESESGKKFKKKLQKELFQNGHQESADSADSADSPRKKKVKREHASPPPSAPASPGGLGPEPELARRGKKRKRQAEADEAAAAEPAPSADDSLTDGSPRKKKKVKREHVSALASPCVSPRPGHACDSPQTERLLQAKVKEERAGLFGLERKRKRQSGEIVEPGAAEPAPLAEPALAADDRVTDGSPRKKKKKRKREKSERDDFSSEPVVDKFEAEETVVETRRPEPRVNGVSEKPFTSEELVDDDGDPDDERSAVTSPDRAELAEPGAGEPRLADRITFEDSEPARARPGRLARYLRGLARLRPAPDEPPAGARVSAADDVWLVRAPRDLPAGALAGAALAPGARGRLRLAGRAYDALPAPGARVALLAGRALRGVRVRGELRLRARVPRPRAPPEPRAPSPAREPAPAARARHPLLGAAYERALRPPRAVRRRLAATRAAPPEPDPELAEPPVRKDRHKKKKKKNKERAEPEPELEREPAPEAASRERNLSSCEPEKRKKRRDDAALWESERAIEESLFDF